VPLQVELYLENCFDDLSPIPPETWEEWFRQWLEMLEDYLPTAPSYEISLRLTTDTEIQTLNSQYRQQDKPTDVLAFASLEADLPQSEEMLVSMPLYLGDIIISIDTAKRQAQQQEHSLSIELAWLTAHGLLHLLGWDHPDEESLIAMLNEQVVLLKKIGIIINLEL
jgi:probable rRNA maturation factor